MWDVNVVGVLFWKIWSFEADLFRDRTLRAHTVRRVPRYLCREHQGALNLSRRACSEGKGLIELCPCAAAHVPSPCIFRGKGAQAYSCLVREDTVGQHIGS